MSSIKWIAVTGVVLYLLSIAGMYFLQRQLLYFPVNAGKYGKYAANQNYEFKHDGVTLRGWVLNPGRPRALLYYGGNAERIDYNIDSFRLLFSGYTVYLVNYRGYGDSEGTPTEQYLYSDALAIYDSIRADYESISLFGKSLGSGVATYVASNREIDRLALVTPYDSIVNVAKTHYPMFPVGLLLTDRYESWKRADKISVPVLVLSAQNDATIPASSTLNLERHFKPEQLTVKQVPSVDHNSISGDPDYYETLADFFGRK